MYIFCSSDTCRLWMNLVSFPSKQLFLSWPTNPERASFSNDLLLDGTLEHLQLQQADIAVKMCVLNQILSSCPTVERCRYSKNISYSFFLRPRLPLLLRKQKSPSFSIQFSFADRDCICQWQCFKSGHRDKGSSSCSHLSASAHRHSSLACLAILLLLVVDFNLATYVVDCTHSHHQSTITTRTAAI